MILIKKKWKEDLSLLLWYLSFSTEKNESDEKSFLSFLWWRIRGEEKEQKLIWWVQELNFNERNYENESLLFALLSLRKRETERYRGWGVLMNELFKCESERWEDKKESKWIEQKRQKKWVKRETWNVRARSCFLHLSLIHRECLKRRKAMALGFSKKSARIRWIWSADKNRD